MGNIAPATRADPQFTWLFMALHFWLISAQSFKDFLPSIVRFRRGAPPDPSSELLAPPP